MKYISNERQLKFSSKEHNNAPWIDEKDVKYYASGREAIVSLIDALYINQKVVLLPAYVPQGVYAPFEKREWKIILYPIDKNLNPIWEEFEELIKKYSPSITTLIHYFGSIQDIKKFTEISHRYNVKVIEDHSHILSSKMKYYGDYILYSLPKMIGVPDGAVLIIRDKNMDIDRLKFYNKRTNRLYIFKQFSMLMATTILSKIPNAKFANLSLAVCSKIFSSYSILMKLYHNPNKMSKISSRIVEKIDFDEVITKRNRYAKIYEEGLSNKNITKLLYIGLYDRATFGYPIVVEERESLYYFLAKKGIYGTYLLSNWNHIPIKLENDSIFNDTKYIMKNHFILPTAFYLSEDDIKKIVNCVNEWAEKNSNR